MRAFWALTLMVFCTVAVAGEVPIGCLTSPTPVKDRAPVPDLSGPLPIPDYLDIIARCNPAGPFGAPPPPALVVPSSTWLDTERRVYADALAKAHADILVVPFQIQGYGLDRIERALMTADLAYAIGSATGKTVADPFLASLALGEGARRIDAQNALALARKIGARHLITAYVGHDKRHAFTLTLQVTTVSGSAGPRPWQHDWRSVAFTDEKTPAFVFHDMLPEVLKAMPLGIGTLSPTRASPVMLPTRITGSPIDVATSAQSVPAPTLALLAALATGDEEPARVRLFERALLAIVESNDDSPAARFLASYALLNLERRPTALAQLASLDTPAAQTLRALLNGNLPDAHQALGKVTGPFERFLLELRVRDLDFAYDRDRPLEIFAWKTLFAAPASWADLIEFRANEFDDWAVGDADWIKRALDRAFPAPGLDADTVVSGRHVTGESTDNVDLDIVTARHVRAIARQLGSTPCCRAETLRAGKWDLLWLLEGVSEHRMQKALDVSLRLRDLPREALAMLARFEPFFDGHPMLAVETALAADALAKHSPEDERGSWQQRAEHSAEAALAWLPGQSFRASQAASVLGVPAVKSELRVDAYGFDYPHRSYWTCWFIGNFEYAPGAEEQRKACAGEALAFSVYDLRPANWLVMPEERRAVLASIGTRFTGHPQRAEFIRRLGPSTPAAASVETPEQRLAAQLAADPEAWTPRLALGQFQLSSGKPFEDAQKTLLAYPAFQDAERARGAVMLANTAYTAGNLFFWYGRSELAKPFYRIAADLETGAESSVTSAYRLHLMSGDYVAALMDSFEHAERYSTPYAYRDYLSLLHAFGRHDDAWQGFSQIMTASEQPQAWTSALVGHRMQGLTEPQIRQWLKRPDIRGAHLGTEQFASWYAILSQSTDRTPSADLGALVEELEGAPVARIDKDGLSVIRPVRDDPSRMELIQAWGLPNRVPVKLPPGTPIKSQRAYLAEGYAATVRGDYALAVKRFAAMSDHYSIMTDALPYFVYAAGKSGVELHIVQVEHPADLSAEYDVWLAHAFFAASHKDVAEARRALLLASRNRPYSYPRPLDTEFQYAQACEWLYRDTRDEAFRAELLAWAKDHQIVQPAQGWAYAMQYSYEKGPQERVRALAMARYLDPASPRIRNAPVAEVKRADAWFKANNPFRMPTEGPASSARTAALIAPLH